MRKFLLQSVFWLIAAVIMQACVPLVPTPPTQSLPPQQLGTVVAGTAAAAQTQTAALISPTFTLTPTRTPSRTPTAVTPTATFFFALPTFTPTITATSLVPTSVPGSGAGNRGGPTPTRVTRAEWACDITGNHSNPRNPLAVNPRSKFSILVSLRNTGTKTWTNNGVDFVYQAGFRHAGTRIQDLPDTIVPGNSTTLKIQFEAPKKPGLYKATWSLMVGNHAFCGLKVAFEVK